MLGLFYFSSGVLYNVYYKLGRNEICFCGQIISHFYIMFIIIWDGMKCVSVNKLLLIVVVYSN